MYVFLAWLPLYLTEVHNLSLKSMGIWASFPWLALMAMVFTAGFLSDRMAHSKNSSRQYTMRTFTAMAGVAVTSSVFTSQRIPQAAQQQRFSG